MHIYLLLSIVRFRIRIFLLPTIRKYAHVATTIIAVELVDNLVTSRMFLTPYYSIVQREENQKIKI